MEDSSSFEDVPPEKTFVKNQKPSVMPVTTSQIAAMFQHNLDSLKFKVKNHSSKKQFSSETPAVESATLSANDCVDSATDHWGNHLSSSCLSPPVTPLKHTVPTVPIPSASTVIDTSHNITSLNLCLADDDDDDDAPTEEDDDFDVVGQLAHRKAVLDADDAQLYDKVSLDNRDGMMKLNTSHSGLAETVKLHESISNSMSSYNRLKFCKVNEKNLIERSIICGEADTNERRKDPETRGKHVRPFLNPTLRFLDFSRADIVINNEEISAYNGKDISDVPTSFKADKSNCRTINSERLDEKVSEDLSVVTSGLKDNVHENVDEKDDAECLTSSILVPTHPKAENASTKNLERYTEVQCETMENKIGSWTGISLQNSSDVEDVNFGRSDSSPKQKVQCDRGCQVTSSGSFSDLGSASKQWHTERRKLGISDEEFAKYLLSVYVGSFDSAAAQTAICEEMRKSTTRRRHRATHNVRPVLPPTVAAPTVTKQTTPRKLATPQNRSPPTITPHTIVTQATKQAASGKLVEVYELASSPMAMVDAPSCSSSPVIKGDDGFTELNFVNRSFSPVDRDSTNTRRYSSELRSPEKVGDGVKTLRISLKPIELISGLSLLKPTIDGARRTARKMKPTSYEEPDLEKFCDVDSTELVEEGLDETPFWFPETDDIPGELVKLVTRKEMSECVAAKTSQTQVVKRCLGDFRLSQSLLKTIGWENASPRKNKMVARAKLPTYTFAHKSYVRDRILTWTQQLDFFVRKHEFQQFHRIYGHKLSMNLVALAYPPSDEIKRDFQSESINDADAESITQSYRHTTMRLKGRKPRRHGIKRKNFPEPTHPDSCAKSVRDVPETEIFTEGMDSSAMVVVDDVYSGATKREFEAINYSCEDDFFDSGCAIEDDSLSPEEESPMEFSFQNFRRGSNDPNSTKTSTVEIENETNLQSFGEEREIVKSANREMKRRQCLAYSRSFRENIRGEYIQKSKIMCGRKCRIFGPCGNDSADLGETEVTCECHDSRALLGGCLGQKNLSFEKLVLRMIGCQPTISAW